MYIGDVGIWSSDELDFDLIMNLRYREEPMTSFMVSSGTKFREEPVTSG